MELVSVQGSESGGGPVLALVLDPGLELESGSDPEPVLVLA